MLALSDVYEALTGSAAPAWQTLRITSFTVDSRQCKRGSLFVALKGGQTDGHNFIADALTRGAQYVIAEDRARAQDMPADVQPAFIELRARTPVAGAPALPLV